MKRPNANLILPGIEVDLSPTFLFDASKPVKVWVDSRQAALASGDEQVEYIHYVVGDGGLGKSRRFLVPTEDLLSRNVPPPGISNAGRPEYPIPCRSITTAEEVGFDNFDQVFARPKQGTTQSDGTLAFQQAVLASLARIEGALAGKQESPANPGLKESLIQAGIGAGVAALGSLAGGTRELKPPVEGLKVDLSGKGADLEMGTKDPQVNIPPKPESTS